ncbi:hypothetical protein IFM89_031387 [Coptis chinensis]|uniref:Uncharacterized protein n=1 Tax=Coptis chinensis TaxID=261450 RepID=A0A835I2E7_9MAGN|nr:hypothetical protein IFM89_031387 [Coptis chinensis]
MRSSDGISDLPDVLIHLIFSFLDMKQVLPASLLSKRWRYLWVSLPYLNFDELMWHDSSNRQKHYQFMAFVNKILCLCEGSNIQKLQISSRNGHYRPYIASLNVDLTIRMKKWMPSALIHELILNYVHVLSCSSLCRLKTLHLTSCFFSLPFIRSSNEFVLDLPTVKNLRLDSCHHGGLGTLTINAPEFECLVVYNRSYQASCKIKICSALNIKTIHFMGHMYEDYHFADLSSLVAAKIETTYKDISLKGKERFLSCLYKIFSGVDAAKYLTLVARDFQEDRLRVLKDVVAGILYLHEGWEARVLHRDIKANNILLDKDMNGRLGDLGLARMHGHGEMASTTRVIGTVGPIEDGMPHLVDWLDATIWRTLLGACRIHKNIELGEHVGEHLIELKAQKAGDYVLLLNIYASVSNWEKVADVIDPVQDRGYWGA